MKITCKAHKTQLRTKMPESEYSKSANSVQGVKLTAGATEDPRRISQWQKCKNKPCESSHNFMKPPAKAKSLQKQTERKRCKHAEGKSSTRRQRDSERQYKHKETKQGKHRKWATKRTSVWTSGRACTRKQYKRAHKHEPTKRKGNEPHKSSKTATTSWCRLQNKHEWQVKQHQMYTIPMKFMLDITCETNSWVVNKHQNFVSN